MFVPGSRIKLEHTLYLNKYDLSDLVQKRSEEVRALYDQRFKNEEKMFEDLQSGIKAWENGAKETRRLQLALNYLEIAPVEHTGNKWVEDEKGCRTISNMVYKMTCTDSKKVSQVIEYGANNTIGNDLLRSGEFRLL